MEDGNSYLNLAVSGSISNSSLTGERGTFAENFSIIKYIENCNLPDQNNKQNLFF